MSVSVATVLEMSKMIVLICNKSLVFGDEFLAQGLFEPCLKHRGIIMLEWGCPNTFSNIVYIHTYLQF